jgi:Spy/CpxP family protein refolding chaperone
MGGHGMGPGMMGGHGMGHGMMGGHGMGPGMMGGHGMGHGMMGGHGMGHGMMGGHGMGPGMMGGYGQGMSGGSGLGAHGALGALNLTADQQEKIGALHEEQRRKSWNALGQLRSEQFRLRQMFNADKVDANAVVEQQKKIDELRQQMLRVRVETHNQIHSVLTSEQRQQLRQLRPWWREEG